MATETVVTDGGINGHVEGQDCVAAALRQLPVKDLLSAGVCAHCVFRLFGVPECTYTSDTLSMTALSAAVKRVVNAEVATANSEESELGMKFCGICFGILQFAYENEKDMVVTKACANDFVVSIVECVKREGHKVDSFTLEVSLPAGIAENEQAIWSYIQKKYSTDPWFLENSVPTRVSVKDVLKSSVTDLLESLMGIKCSSTSPFHIRLTYTNAMLSTKNQSTAEKTETNKRRKTGSENGGVTNGCVTAGNKHSDSVTNEQHGFQLEKVNKPCNLSVSCGRSPIYIGGRYLKYSRNVSQTRWVIDDERMGEASVEEIIGSNILPVCAGDNYKFHAAGREDIDVRMLGSGRPFLIEIQNARHVPCETSIKAIEEKINNLENKLIGVKNIKTLGSQGWDLMREGESEKQKQYAALVWISRSLEDDDVKNLSSLKDLTIMQKTPVRVLHRRSPLERPKIIHWMKIERIAGNSNYFLLHLCTQVGAHFRHFKRVVHYMDLVPKAGTYIKEFVHGDLGRTHPSVGSILGCRSEILQLDVTDVKMDYLNE